MKHKGETEAQYTRRILIWRHNSFLGQTKRAQSTCKAIIESTTATDKAQETTHTILTLLEQLYEELKVRR